MGDFERRGGTRISTRGFLPSYTEMFSKFLQLGQRIIRGLNRMRPDMGLMTFQDGIEGGQYRQEDEL